MRVWGERSIPPAQNRTRSETVGGRARVLIGSVSHVDSHIIKTKTNQRAKIHVTTCSIAHERPDRQIYYYAPIKY